MRIYKAKVVKINPPSDDGKRRRQILVAPRQQTGAGPHPVSASPPSWMPTSVMGSGIVSYPEVGQECLVAEENSERHILTYTQPANVSPYGQLHPREVTEGGFSLQVMGLNPAIFEMDRNGGIFFSGNPFAQIKVRGDEKTVYIRSKSFEKRFAGGKETISFVNNDGTVDADAENTQFKVIYGSHDENPGFWDVELDTEEVNPANIASASPSYSYSDKTIITGGYHVDGSVYNIDTRQSVGEAVPSKNVVTNFRLGLQSEHNRWGQEIAYPAGTLLEWSGKKNITGNMGSFMFRYGKLESNYQNQGVKGEILRLQALEGLNNGTVYGNPQTDPVGRGKGYDYSKESSAKQQFTQSFGYLPRNTDLEQKKSVFRQFIHYNGSNEAIYSKKLLGGDDGSLIYKNKVGKGEIFLQNTLKADENGNFELKYSEDGKEEVISIENQKITLKSSKDVSISIDGEKIELRMKNSVLTLKPEGMTYNGRPLVFDTLIEWLDTHKSSFGIDSMSAPVGMFPSTLSDFQSKKELPHKSGSPQGFSTTES